MFASQARLEGPNLGELCATYIIDERLSSTHWEDGENVGRGHEGTEKEEVKKVTVRELL